MNNPSILPDTLTASEARDHFYDILEQTRKYYRRFTITHKGKPQAVVLPLEELESFDETLEILSDKNLVKKLNKALLEVKQGKTTPLSSVVNKLHL